MLDRLYIALLAGLLSASLQAQTFEQSVTKVWPFDTSAVLVGDTIIVAWQPPSQTVESFGIQDMITLKCDPYSLDSSLVPMDVHVQLKITATTNDDHGNYNPSTDKDTLMIVDLYVGMRDAELIITGLDTALSAKNMDAFMFKNSHKYEVILYSLRGDTGSGYAPLNALPKGLSFTLSMFWFYVNVMDPAFTPDIVGVTKYTCNGIADETKERELELAWSPLSGAMSYDVEWTWIDNYDATGGNTLPINATYYDLRRDATRVSVPADETKYRIPLLYDNGHILWRVRATSMWAGVQINSAWSPIPEHGTLAQAQAVNQDLVVEVHAHHPRKNWQSSMSFAEDAKHKEVITYADGTSRVRQVVTRNNSLGAPIIGETVYDVIGRPAVDIMPVPYVKEGCVELGTDNWAPIEYHTQFNQVIDGTDIRDFTWKELVPELGCGPIGPLLYNGNGAEHYYSEEYLTDIDPLVEPPSFLPKALGKPFSQTQYTRDHTGRLRQQGGVGPEFQLGEHATTYYYGKPEQIQLDRLFGSEAGYAHHYQKNVVIDPNEQVSVSYIDLYGRTVATALSCEAPQNGLEPLTPITDEIVLTTDLFNGLPNTSTSIQSIDGTSLTFLTTIPVACAGTYILDYSVVPLALTDTCWPGYCAHCIYDLGITLVDQCGAIVIDHTVVAGQVDEGPGGELIFMSDCDNLPPLLNTSFSSEPEVYLEKGEYTLTKVLRVHSGAREHYVQALMEEDPAVNQCLRTRDDFIAEASAAIAADCEEVTCQECYEALGTLEDFMLEHGGTAYQYELMLAECEELCGGLSWCETFYRTMLDDFKMNGQYARIALGADLLLGAADKTSVFYFNSPGDRSVLSNAFPPGGSTWRAVDQGLPLWQQPLVNTASGWLHQYLDNTGDRTKITVVWDDLNGVYAPPVTDDDLVFPEDPDLSSALFTWPENLAELSDFLGHFRPGWERSLVRFHPEYCYYRECRQFSEVHSSTDEQYSSDEFDKRLMLANDFDAAVNDGLITFIGGTAIFNYQLLDPFASESIYGSWATQLNDRFDEYQHVLGTNYSMLAVAAALARCGGDLQAPPGTCQNFGSLTPDPTIRDLEWAYLRGFYQSEKYRIQKLKCDATVSGCECPGLNVCIGESSTANWWGRMHYPLPPPMFIPGGNWATYGQYYATIIAAMASMPGNMECQPCFTGTYAWFAGKARRVPDPELMPGSNMSGLDAAFEQYQINGECPTASAWKALIAELAPSMVNNAFVDLSTSNSWFALHSALNDHQPYFDIPNAQAAISINGNNDVTITLTYDDNSTCTVSLQSPSPGFDWTTIAHTSQLLAPNSSGNFTLHAYTIQGTNQQGHQIEGFLDCHSLHPCNFPPKCSPNELALSFEQFFNMLAPQGLIANANVSLHTQNIPPGTVPPTIQAHMSIAILSRFSGNYELAWLFNPNTNTFYLTDNNGSGSYVIDELSTVPSNTPVAAYLANARFFQNITSDFNNRFTVQVYGAYGNHICELRGRVRFIDQSGTQNIPFGICELPAPIGCEGAQTQLATDLQAVLEQIVPANAADLSQIDLWTSPWMTQALAIAICPQCDSVWQVNNIPMLVGELTGNTVEFNECLQLTFEISGQNTFTSIGAPVIGDLDENGHFHGITYTLFNGTNPVGQLHVNTCFAMAPCEECPMTQQPEELSMMYSLASSEEELLALGVVYGDPFWAGYMAYSLAVDSLNLRLEYEPADPEYVPTLTYPQYRKAGLQHSARTYLNFIRRYHPQIDLASLLYEPLSFVAEYGYAVNVKEEYARYERTVESYNQQALAASVMICK